MRLFSMAADGTGGSVLRHVDPPVRVVAAAGVALACVVAPGRTPAGVVLAVAAALSVWAAAGMRPGLAGRVLGLTAAIFVPLALVQLGAAAWTRHGTVGSALWLAAAIGIKGAAVLLVSSSVVATLSAAELHSALSRLPLPVPVRLLVLQIVHQAGLLIDQTPALGRALSLRGARPGWRQRARLAHALPRMWLERQGSRAARATAAMEVRGYDRYRPDPFPAPRLWRLADALAIGGAAAALLTGLALRAL